MMLTAHHHYAKWCKERYLYCLKWYEQKMGDNIILHLENRKEMYTREDDIIEVNGRSTIKSGNKENHEKMEASLIFLVRLCFLFFFFFCSG
jgi:hypothetical protein